MVGAVVANYAVGDYTDLIELTQYKFSLEHAACLIKLETLLIKGMVNALKERLEEGINITLSSSSLPCLVG